MTKIRNNQPTFYNPARRAIHPAVSWWYGCEANSRYHPLIPASSGLPVGRRTGKLQKELIAFYDELFYKLCDHSAFKTKPLNISTEILVEEGRNKNDGN